MNRMTANGVIELYIDDVVRLLPRRQREDVAKELRSLLNEELGASGSAADEATALALVRGHGRPNEVAARYRAPWSIIDAADSTGFVRAAIIGGGVLILLGAFEKKLPTAKDQNWVGIGILVWLGVLVLAFGLKNWIRLHRPAKLWKPHDRDRVSRLGAALIVPFASCIVVLYAAPVWVLNTFSGGRIPTARVAYTPEFQQVRLPCFLALMVGMLMMLTFAAIRGRWDRLTRRINLGINMGLACMLLAFGVEGNVFQHPQADEILRGILSLAGVVYLAGMAAMLYGELGRVGRGGVVRVA